jgi:hypothetical protein
LFQLRETSSAIAGGEIRLIDHARAPGFASFRAFARPAQSLEAKIFTVFLLLFSLFPVVSKMMLDDVT